MTYKYDRYVRFFSIGSIIGALFVGGTYLTSGPEDAGGVMMLVGVGFIFLWIIAEDG